MNAEEERKTIDRGLQQTTLAGKNNNNKGERSARTKMPPLSKAAVHGDISSINNLLKDPNLNGRYEFKFY